MRMAISLKKKKVTRNYLTMIEEERLLFFVSAKGKRPHFLAAEKESFSESKFLSSIIPGFFSKGTRCLGHFADLPVGEGEIARLYVLDGGYPLHQNGVESMFFGKESLLYDSLFDDEKMLSEQALAYATIFTHPIRNIPLLQDDQELVDMENRLISRQIFKIPSQKRDQFKKLTESASSLTRINRAYISLCEEYDIQGDALELAQKLRAKQEVAL